MLLIPLLAVARFVSLKPDRHVATRHSTSQRTEAGAEETRLPTGLARFALRSGRSLRPGTGQGDRRRTGGATRTAGNQSPVPRSEALDHRRRWHRGQDAVAHRASGLPALAHRWPLDECLAAAHAL